MRRRPAVLLLAALLMAACGADGASPTPAPPSGAPDSSPTTAPTEVASDDPASPSARPSPPAAVVPSPVPGGPTGDPPALDVVVVAGGLDRPLDVAVVPGDPSAMVVAEQVGRLRIIRDGALVEAPLLDIAERVTAGGEQGLLGVAFHPDPADGRVFVYYTDRRGEQVVASFRTDPVDRDRADPASERRLLVMPDEFPNHNGGALQFGPDGYLYVSTGDGGGGGDPLGSGQRLDTLLAKVLRLDVDIATEGDPAYAIPQDNPFIGQDGARGEIWLTGLRNPWRMRFDAATGDLWIGDVGQGELEEIDLAPAGVGGLDFGWNVMEGSACFRADDCDRAGLTPPVAEYRRDEGCAVTGGSVYRGSAWPALVGWYVLSDYCSGRFWLLDATAGPGQVPIPVLDSGRSISAIGPGPDLELYATDLSAGELVRLVVAG